MKIDVKGFIVPHNGEPYYTCADRYAINRESQIIAVTDGVGGSLYPSFLSERIVNEFCENPYKIFDTENNFIRNFKSEFDSYCQARFNELPENKRRIIALKAEQTSSSSCTFVGCFIENGVWKYYAIGDSYLFYISPEGELTSISSMANKEFSVFPEYLSTNGTCQGTVISGTLPLKEGHILLMTDALSDWFLKYYNEDPSILEKLLSIKTHSDYENFCQEELSSGRMHDDDCAIIIASITGSASNDCEFYVSHLDNIDSLVLGDLRSANDTLKNENETLRNNNRTLTAENETLKNNNKTLTAENETLKNNNKTLTAESETLKNNNRTLTAENETLKNNNRTLTAENETTEDSIEASHLRLANSDEITHDLKKKILVWGISNINIILSVTIILLQIISMILNK